MSTLTAVSFVFNEIETVEQSLIALRPHVDEIVIVDLESKDGTTDVIKKYADKMYVRPWMMCGDGYKPFLREHAAGDWLLWFYPDEIFPERTAKSLKSIINTNEYTSFAFMRQEYMDGIRLMPHGTPESPNYQNRLHKKMDGVEYNGLVHWEVPKELHTCPMPPEYYFEHHKTSVGQEFDSIRLYIFYHHLIWLYGDTQLEPYAESVRSYHDIINQSEAKNLSGERGISLAEEFWWDWSKYADRPRLSLDEFRETVGVDYPTFLKIRKQGGGKTFFVDPNIVDEALQR